MDICQPINFAYGSGRSKRPIWPFWSGELVDELLPGEFAGGELSAIFKGCFSDMTAPAQGLEVA